MPTTSAKQHHIPKSSVHDEYRSKTAAPFRENVARIEPARRVIAKACNTMSGKNLSRVQQAVELSYNDALRVVGLDSCPRSAPVKKVRLYATVLPKREFNRIQRATKVMTLEEKLQKAEDDQCEAERIREESERRKQALREIDEARAKARLERDQAKGVPAKTDLFAEEKMQILEKAFILKHEQEEEVKLANRIILNAKCHVIREAQIQEKQELSKEQRKEEIRLEKVMNDIAKQSLDAEDDEFVKLQESKQKYAQEIKKQLEEREHLRFLEAERIEEEAKINAKASEALKREEERIAALAKERRQQLRDDLKKISEMSTFFKKCLLEQEKEAEMRIQRYMQAKAERERKLALEQKLAKEAFERKQQLIFLLQQKRMESKTELEEMALTREQENIEREYRRKEKEAALRKKQLEKELIQSRNAQLNEQKHRQALQLMRNEEDFQRIVKHLKELEERQQQIENQRSKCRQKYRSEIINQMNQKEMERRQMDTRAKNEHIAWKEKEKRHEQNIRAVIQTKLRAMRDAHLPEKYIRDVENQLNRIAEKKSF